MIYDEQGQMVDGRVSKFVRDIEVKVGEFVINLLKTKEATPLEIEALTSYIQSQISTAVLLAKLTAQLESELDE